MKILAAILLLSLCCFSQEKDREASAEPATRSTTCVTTSFSGSVKRGLPYVQPIGGGLTYRLAPLKKTGSDAAQPSSFQGWTIEVAYLRKKGDMEREFSWVLTPPYRQWNARQLNTAFGNSIASVLKADHTVYFPLELFDYAEADKIVKRIMWRSSPPEVKEAATELPRIPVGSAALKITGQELGGDKNTPTSIDSLSFRVELTVPKTLQLTPDLARRAKLAACPQSPVIPMLEQMQQ